MSKDAAQVLGLMRVAFGPSLDAEGRDRLDQSVSASQQPWFGLPALGVKRIEPGFVWVESGRIVGNVTLLTTRQPGRYLVVNVAVHPEYRRRGIARALMQAVMDTVHAHHGRVILLQVEHRNEPALNLYRHLGFAIIGDVTSWKASYSRLRQLPFPVGDRGPDRVGAFILRPLLGHEWRQAYIADEEAMHPDLDWPQPIDLYAYRQGLWRSFLSLLQARQQETWVIVDVARSRLLALGNIQSEWGSAHQLRLRVSPAMAGQLERPLLAKLIRRLAFHASRSVRIEHPAADELTSSLLQEAGFRVTRTLTTMRFDY
jgi:GNAT superfamily N-acetyltransferase